MTLANRAFQRMGKDSGVPQQAGDGGILWQQGGGASGPNPLNPGLPGTVPETPIPSPLTMLGEQEAFRYLMESNGYSMSNALARPSAQQAYEILRYAGLEPVSAQQLLKSSGYSLKNIVEPFSAEELQKLLRNPGLDVESTKCLME